MSSYDMASMANALLCFNSTLLSVRDCHTLVLRVEWHHMNHITGDRISISFTRRINAAPRAVNLFLFFIFSCLPEPY